MKGGGVYYCLGKRGEKTINKCLIEAMMRDDTVINPLTFSSMAGFIFVLHRQNGIVDAAGDIFIRSDNIAVNGKKKTTSRKWWCRGILYCDKNSNEAQRSRRRRFR